MALLNAGEIPGFTMQKRYIQPDGTIIWINMTIAPAEARDPEHPRHLCMIEDVTEHKLAEDALEAAEEKYRRLVEETSDTIYSTDRSGHFTYVNPSAVDITGYAEQELVGMVFKNLIHPDWLGYVQDFYYKQRAEALPKTSLEFPIITKQSKIRWVSQTLNAIIKDDRFEGVHGTVRDITEHKQAEYELDESRERYRELSKDLKIAVNTKDKFFSIMAHDLKGPLAAFSALAKLFATNFNKFTLAEMKDMIEQLHTSSSQTYKLLENLLDWSRLQLGRMEFNPEAVNVFELLQENIEILKSQADGKDLSIINSASSINSVFADRNMLTTIVRNLIANAIKFTPRGGEIVLSSKVDEEQSDVVISVSDTGIGIPSEIIASIFNIGSKRNTLGTEGEASTGLGLTLCKEFVEKNRGRIWVKSAVGKGNTFSFALPPST